MKQGELFGSQTIPAAAPEVRRALQAPNEAPQAPGDGTEAASAPARVSDALRRRLASRDGLWVDPFTAEYIARRLARGEARIEFIAADARCGRSAFHTLPASALVD